ncbi:MAG TPA: cytochrome b [Xanthomonadaceae bacterium]|nr:cytochrome b [Xanthomonadaceae bacterium]
MPIRNSADRWGLVSVSLHWLIAAAVLVMVVLGVYMKGLPIGPDKIKLYALHKSIGMTVLTLVLLRLVWRVFAGRPLPPPMPAWQRHASRISHVLLYMLLLTVPLAGWVMNSAANFPLRWFDLFTIPAIVEPDRELRALAGQIHGLAVVTLLLLVSVHVAAALKHHYVDRDNVLRGMFGLRPRPPEKP